jgi:ATP phosphoribosyltransferase regulatory subunit HisZ
MLVQRNTEGKLSTPEATRLKSLQETKDKYRKADCLGKQRNRDTLKELSNAKDSGEVLSTEQIQKWELLDARRLRKNDYDARFQAKRREEKKHLFRIGKWTSEEHEAFLQGLEVHGRDWVKIATLIPSRSNDQICWHARKKGF